MLFIASYLFLASAKGNVEYSISGLSSGGYMAGQLHVAHSSSITGAAIIAGGPYYCTQGTFNRIYSTCYATNQVVDTAPLADYIRSMSALGLIDPISSLEESKIYIFSGTLDQNLTLQIVGSTYELYSQFVPVSKINFVNNIPAAHAWPTMNSGNSCDYYGPYYVNDCDYDTSGVFLQEFLGKLKNKGTMKSNNLFTFSQADYVDINAASMDSLGFIYVPDECKNKPKDCRIHVTIHGCNQGSSEGLKKFIELIEILDWAETNELIVIFPLIFASSANLGTGCWDFWGYTGPDFALKSGLQVSAIHNMAQDYVNIARKVVK